MGRCASAFQLAGGVQRIPAPESATDAKAAARETITIRRNITSVLHSGEIQSFSSGV
jgi:hypothetical protein